MILILFFLSLLFLLEPASVNGFTYQFVLENNVIDFDFIKVKIPENSQTEIPESNDFLSFEYRLESKASLPTEVPLFIVAFDQEVAFYADASFIDAKPRVVEINMKDFSTNSGQMPVFYKNNLIDNFKLEISKVGFVSQAAENQSSIEINDLSVIREKDGSVTIVFSVQEEVKAQHTYQLFCLDDQQEISSSIILSQKDNFIWPEYAFINLVTNRKSELIFHLEDFTCSGELYVATDDGSVSDKTLIIEVEKL